MLQYKYAIYCNMGQSLLQSVTGIRNCDKKFLRSVAGITRFNSY